MIVGRIYFYFVYYGEPIGATRLKVIPEYNTLIKLNAFGGNNDYANFFAIRIPPLGEFEMNLTIPIADLGLSIPRSPLAW